MRVAVLHEETLTWPEPARAANLALRATPRDDDAQHVISWHVEVDGPAGARLVRGRDAWGNVAHRVTVDGPVDRITLRAEGIVSTDDTHGVVAGAADDRLPAGAYLRPRPATTPTRRVREFARDHGGDGSALTRLHALLAAVREEVERDEDARDHAAAEVLGLRRGSARGLAHLFTAGAIAMDVPARVALGWFAGEPGLTAWSEARVEGLGWVAFDPARGLCVTPRHVCLAVDVDAGGLDLGRAVAFGVGTPERTAETTVTAS